MAAHGCQHFRRRGARFQAALGGELVHQAVGQRIAERHAEFQHVHPGPVKRQRQPAGGVQIRIARADVNHEPLASGGLEPGKRSRCGSWGRSMPQNGSSFNAFAEPGSLTVVIKSG